MKFATPFTFIFFLPSLNVREGLGGELLNFRSHIFGAVGRDLVIVDQKFGDV